MERLIRCSFVVLSLATYPVITGCSVPGAITCNSTLYISPTAATLDHTLSGNSQQFKVGVTYPAGCAAPASMVAPTWSVSDTVDASITTGGVASCVNAAAAPVTVNPGIAGYPTATLTCK